MNDAYIVSAACTAGGRRKGALVAWHPVKLAAEVLNATLERTCIDPAAIDDAIMGCVSQVGEQCFDVGGHAVLASRLPGTVSATAIDRRCGASQQAIQSAAQAVMSGTQDVVLAAGVESMTRVPMFTATKLPEQAGMGTPFSVHPDRAHLRLRPQLAALAHRRCCPGAALARARRDGRRQGGARIVSTPVRLLGQ